MKNVHIIPTDKPSRVAKSTKSGFNVAKAGVGLYESGRFGITTFNIYITSDEYIGLSWYLDGDLVRKGVIDDEDYWSVRKDYKKIVMTSDQDLIKDGVQAIDDEFLEWFVKNPSCEEVEVIEFSKILLPENGWYMFGYKIIIPKEEPNQETLEEFTKDRLCGMFFNNNSEREIAERFMVEGAKWQQEQIGKSEFLQKLRATKSDAEARRLIFEQFKKK